MQLQFVLFFFSTVEVFCLYHIDDTSKTFNFHFQLHIVSRRKKKFWKKDLFFIIILFKFIMHSEICMK